MSKKQSPYYQALEFLIKNNEILAPDKKMFLVFKYKDLDFDYPREIGAFSIINIYDFARQDSQFRQDGILKFYEIEPVNVVGNSLSLQINVGVSTNTDESNYDVALNRLSSIERESLLNIIGHERKKISLFMNIETYRFSFGYDCEEEYFKLGSYQKTIIPAP